MSERANVIILSARNKRKWKNSVSLFKECNLRETPQDGFVHLNCFPRRVICVQIHPVDDVSLRAPSYKTQLLCRDCAKRDRTLFWQWSARTESVFQRRKSLAAQARKMERSWTHRPELQSDYVWSDVCRIMTIIDSKSKSVCCESQRWIFLEQPQAVQRWINSQTYFVCVLYQRNIIIIENDHLSGPFVLLRY